MLLFVLVIRSILFLSLDSCMSVYLSIIPLTSEAYLSSIFVTSSLVLAKFLAPSTLTLASSTAPLVAILCDSLIIPLEKANQYFLKAQTDCCFATSTFCSA